SNGVWSIWKRYGLVGLPKTVSSMDLPNLFFSHTDVVSPLIIEANELSKDFGKIPFSEYIKKARRLRKQLEKENLYYYALRVGITEAITLSWTANPEKQLALIDHLKQWAPKRGDLYLKYLLLIGESIAYAQTLQNEKAINCAKICRKVLQHVDHIPSLWRELANLYEHVGKYRESLRIIEKILSGKFGTYTQDEKEILYANLADLLAVSGKYHECLNSLQQIDKQKMMLRALVSILRAQCMLGQGKIYEAQEYARRALELSRRDEIIGLLHVASLIFASSAAALGEKSKANNMISRLNPLFKKSTMKKDVFIRELITSSKWSRLDMGNIPHGAISHSVCQLLVRMAYASKTLALTDYRRAYNFALNHNMLGLFHRFLVFFSESVINIHKKGKSAGLLRRYVQLPVYKKDVPVYRVNFLGPLQIYRRQRLRISLPLKDKAFLIYIAHAKKRRLELYEIYNTFWPHSNKPARNLSHLLVRVRKSLKLPSQYLYMKPDNLCCDCQFMTDYNEFENYIAQAKALQRIGNWKMAEKEYCSAFLLFRERPFTGMYDNFSESRRIEVIFKFEESARHFIEELSKQYNKDNTHDKKVLSPTVKRTLHRIGTIVPDLRGCIFSEFHL
ncbi:MAG: hypothetical protein JSV97_12540, partial [candidate division WOR-3 bacterium]